MKFKTKAGAFVALFSSPDCSDGAGLTILAISYHGICVDPNCHGARLYRALVGLSKTSALAQPADALAKGPEICRMPASRKEAKGQPGGVLVGAPLKASA